MKAFWLLASVLTITRSLATSAAPTSDMRLDRAGEPMPTEFHGSRDEGYLVTSRRRPSGRARISARSYVLCGVGRLEGTLKHYSAHVVFLGALQSAKRRA